MSPTGPLTGPHRDELARAVDALAARETGTGLHDTILAAYQAARDSYQRGVPNQVLLFTDGRNEDDLTPSRPSSWPGNSLRPRIPADTCSSPS